MKTILITLSFSILFTAACAQSTSRIGGSCEGCEAALEYGKQKLNAIDTLPDFNDPGPKLVISGTIYQRDGKTPAKDVILYVYHTDQKGIYAKKGGDNGRHGYIRGWVKTGADGKYTFYTLRPASYPNSKIPQHIHPIIKEPGKNEYWVDEYLFSDDPFLTANEKSHLENRGGNGILELKKDAKGVWSARRDIVLGLNVPDYR